MEFAINPILQGDVKKEYVFKVLIIGEISTGKTSILKRYVQGFFTESYKITVSFPTFFFTLGTV